MAEKGTYPWRRTISAASWANWCRDLAQYLESGRTMLDALARLGRRARPPVAGLCDDLARRLGEGEELAQALSEAPVKVPPILVAMAKVAERTGHLPEVLRELEEYFRFLVSLRREFIKQITWPALQLLAAIFIIAGVIWLLGALGLESTDLLGLGLSGTAGAIVWLAGWGVLFGSLVGGYYLLRETLDRAAVVDAILDRIPILGPCLKTLALSRMCLAMHLTLDGGMEKGRAIQWSLRASDHGVLLACGDSLVAAVRDGQSLADAFDEQPIFPAEFRDTLAAAELSGTVPEQLKRLAKELDERARLQLALLNTVAGWLVWAIVAGLIVFLIFRIFFNTYLPALNDAMQGI